MKRWLIILALLALYTICGAYFAADLLEAGKLLPFSSASFWLLASAICMVLVGYELDHRK